MELDLLKMIFSSSLPPSNTCPDGAWISVKTLRETNPGDVDPWFAYHFSLVTPDPAGNFFAYFVSYKILVIRMIFA